MRNLYFSNVPAPYRVDLCRFLHGALDCEICFQDPVPAETDIPLHRWTLKDVRPLIERYRPVLVFVPEFSPAALRALSLRKRFGFQVISFCDDSMDMINGHDFGWKHRLARHYVPGRVDELIVHSPAVRDWYQKRYGKGLVIPIIADERRVRPDLERVLPLSERIRPGEKPIVAFVGRLVALKNIPALIRAFESLKERAQLVIIGDGPERQKLASMAPEAIFTGMLAGDELLAWYNLIDVLVLPSAQEAYGAVTGEALMAGAKVVVSRKAGSSSLVRAGENGFIVAPDDVTAMTECIDTLLKQVPVGRPLRLRENLLPCRFETAITALLEALK